jgi:hypothetical protein
MFSFFAKNIKFVVTNENLANVKDARPIEGFWSNLKGKVFEKS